jgi:chemosensory pili system protein ChpA (sensor histidine kinase/response regulator)
VPANLLETVLLITQDRMDDAYANGVLRQEVGADIPFFSAGAILGVSMHGHFARPRTRQRSVAVIRSAGQRVALHVDEVLGNREVVVKNLGAQLSRLPGLVGVSVLASGVVVLIYNPVALMNVFGDVARRAEVFARSGAVPGASGLTNQPSDDETAETLLPLVLVVDDSITVRRVTQRLLSRAGYRVALASDGVQALTLLRDERPALVLSDLEMPRMDGMELTRQIRADAKLSDLPIIIITSRTAQKHRDHAAALGADHYLGKPYAEAELLDLVRSHCAVAEFA